MKNRKICNYQILIGLLPIFLFLVPVPCWAISYIFNPVDYPGAGYTQPFDINNRGQIAGYYSDAAGDHHGFLLSDGIFTSFDYPGSKWTFAFGINDSSQIVGYYQDTTDHYHGYLLSGDTFSSFDYPVHWTQFL